MICQSCRAAGTLNRRGREERDNDLLEKAEETFQAAEALHAECKGCYCQHVTRLKLHD